MGIGVKGSYVHVAEGQLIWPKSVGKMEAEVHMLNGLQSADQGKDGLSASNRGDALSKSNVIKLGLEKNIR